MQTLDYFVKSIGIAIRSAQQETERYSLEAYQNWFVEEKDENGEVSLKPRTIIVSWPRNDGTYEPKRIPIIALLNHHSLTLDETKIRMSLISRWDEEKKQVIVESGPLPQESNGNNNQSIDRCEIELTFKGNPSGEGVARYIDKFVREI